MVTAPAGAALQAAGTWSEGTCPEESLAASCTGPHKLELFYEGANLSQQESFCGGEWATL
ncbi:MAG: hypothetical protein AB8I08_19020 [Sandaracinaceae bacterium]